jgi:hypothetical protein
MIRRKTKIIFSIILTLATLISATTLSAESSHGVILSVSSISNVKIVGQHSRAPASGNELMKVDNAKIDSINALGYSYRYSNAESSQWKLDLGLT